MPSFAAVGRRRAIVEELLVMMTQRGLARASLQMLLDILTLVAAVVGRLAEQDIDTCLLFVRLRELAFCISVFSGAQFKLCGLQGVSLCCSGFAAESLSHISTHADVVKVATALAPVGSFEAEELSMLLEAFPLNLVKEGALHELLHGVLPGTSITGCTNVSNAGAHVVCQTGCWKIWRACIPSGWLRHWAPCYLPTLPPPRPHHRQLSALLSCWTGAGHPSGVCRIFDQA